MTAPKNLKSSFNVSAVRNFLRLSLLSATLLAAGGLGYNTWKNNYSAEPVESVPPTPVVSVERQEARLQQWHENWRDMCVIPGREEPQATSQRSIRDALKEMEREEVVGVGLVKAIKDAGTAICVDPAPGNRVSYYSDSWNTIFLRRNLNNNHTLLQITHEARRVMQKDQGMLGRIKLSDTHQRLRLDFALEADVAATTTLMAWRLYQQGRGDLWNQLRSSTLYSDLPTAFTGAMLSTKDEKAATLAVFERWYARETRMADAYRERKHVTFMAGTDRRELPTYEMVPQGYFNRLGELPDGTNYGANKSPMLRR